MGRRPRIHYVGALYHVIARGNNRQALYAHSDDLVRFGGLIAEGVDRFGHRIHAFCWMTNHVHIAIEVDEVPLSSILHSLCSRYSNWFNRKYSRTGHLFERRYRAGLIENRESVCRLVRYIHLNPVRAGLVDDPAEYPWSSHRSYLGTSRVPWLETRRILQLFGDSKQAARQSLAEYVVEDLGGDPDATAVQDLATLIEDEREEESPKGEGSSTTQGPLGPPLWRLATLEELLEVVAANKDLEVADLSGRSQKRTAANARAVSAHIARQCQNLSIADLSRALDRDPSTVARAAEGLIRRLPSNPGLKREIEEICSRLADTVLKRI